MKTFLFAAALMLGGAAYAQDTGQTGGTGGTGMAPGGTVAPSNAAPKRDARGVPVISAPADVPAGYNQPPNTSGAAPSTGTNPTMPPAGPLPPCTRKRTDNCTQTYERHHGTAGTSASSTDAGTGGGDATATDASAGGDMTATGSTTTTKKTTHHRRTHRRHRK